MERKKDIKLFCIFLQAGNLSWASRASRVINNIILYPTNNYRTRIYIIQL